jgi:serine/threonine protein kinase
MLMSTQSPAVQERLADAYRIEAELGRGGMARVYRVVHEPSGARYALKRLVATGENSATLRAMFEHEYHTLVQLAHPNIIRVFEYGLIGDDPYYGYFMLTHRPAHAARTFGELPKVWQRSPARPQELQPNMPRALSDLIMAMISLDPRTRPASAAEVYERFSAIAELTAEDHGLTARAFLTHPTLVGRVSANVAVATALRDTLGGRGGTLCISAPSGLSCSRALREMALCSRASH